MTLEDVAELVSPKKPEKIVRLLECFRSGNNPTIEELKNASQESEKMVRYYLTKMRNHALIESYQDGDGVTRYKLDPFAFKTMVKNKWIDPLRRLVSE